MRIDSFSQKLVPNSIKHRVVMDQETFSKFLSERYDDQVNWYDKKSLHNQKVYKRLQWIIIIFSALTPVLIELHIDFFKDFQLSRLAIVTSLLVTICSAAIKTFKYQENWINYRTTCETLRKEKYLYQASLGDYKEAEDKEALFVGRVERVISRENTLWFEHHLENKNKEKK